MWWLSLGDLVKSHPAICPVGSRQTHDLFDSLSKNLALFLFLKLNAGILRSLVNIMCNYFAQGLSADHLWFISWVWRLIKLDLVATFASHTQTHRHTNTLSHRHTWAFDILGPNISGNHTLFPLFPFPMINPHRSFYQASHIKKYEHNIWCQSSFSLLLCMTMHMARAQHSDIFSHDTQDSCLDWKQALWGLQESNAWIRLQCLHG
jgi:hypothetical protein